MSVYVYTYIKLPAPLDPTRRQRSPELREREKSWMRGADPGGGWPSMPR